MINIVDKFDFYLSRYLLLFKIILLRNMKFKIYWNGVIKQEEELLKFYNVHK